MSLLNSAGTTLQARLDDIRTGLQHGDPGLSETMKRLAQGGGAGPEDAGLLATALRETHEEIGVLSLRTSKFWVSSGWLDQHPPRQWRHLSYAT